MMTPIFGRHDFDTTAFMSGQTGSKRWLCEHVEPLLPENAEIWLLGGWYGVTSFLLFNRGRTDLSFINYDIDPEAVRGSLVLNEELVNRQRFMAEVRDVNSLIYDRPVVVINTSVEHMHDRTWFEIIPDGTLVVLQTNNMPHEDHLFSHQSVDDLKREFPLSQFIFTGELPFAYSEWGFTRFMCIGRK